jgi:hypothetical protein
MDGHEHAIDALLAGVEVEYPATGGCGGHFRGSGESAMSDTVR